MVCSEMLGWPELRFSVQLAGTYQEGGTGVLCLDGRSSELPECTASQYTPLESQTFLKYFFPVSFSLSHLMYVCILNVDSGLPKAVFISWGFNLCLHTELHV